MGSQLVVSDHTTDHHGEVRWDSQPPQPGASHRSHRLSLLWLHPDTPGIEASTTGPGPGMDNIRPGSRTPAAWKRRRTADREGVSSRRTILNGKYIHGCMEVLNQKLHRDIVPDLQVYV